MLNDRAAPLILGTKLDRFSAPPDHMPWIGLLFFTLFSLISFLGVDVLHAQKVAGDDAGSKTKPQPTVSLTAQEKAWLSKNQTVRVCATEHAPLLFYKDGKPIGISADFLNQVSKHTGIKFDISKPLRDFSSSMKALIDHKGPDVIAGLNPTPERKKVIIFTKTYWSSPKFIFTRDDSPFVPSMENLYGKTVAVIRGYLTHKLIAENYPNIKLLISKNNKDALRAVSSGKAFAFIGSLQATSAMINEFGLANLKASAPSALPDAVVSMGIRSDWPELRDIMDKVFDAMPGHQKAAIINQWSSVKFDYGTRAADIVKWILIFGGGAYCIVLLFVVWNRNLRKQVHLRTAELNNSIQSLRAEITDRIKAEEKLKESEQKFRHLVEQSPLSVQIFSRDGRIIQINEAWKELWGISDEILPEILERYNVLEDEEARRLGVLPHIKKAFRGESVLLPAIEYDASMTLENLETSNAGGQKAYVQARFYPVKNSKGEVVNVVSIEEDITKHKQAEQEIQQYQRRLKALAFQLTISEEKERRHLAADLHDLIGHSLALARIQLAAVREASSKTETAVLVADISKILLQAIQDTKNLMFELSSPSLNEIGLGAAISEWLEESLGRRYGLETEFTDEIDDRLRKTLDDNIRAILFRNVRELLTNVIKHAKAKKVGVHLKTEDGMVTIVIQDDGVGFDHQAVIQPGEEGGGFGLFSIQERMKDLGGSLEIVSGPGKGCKAILTVPVGGR